MLDTFVIRGGIVWVLCGVGWGTLREGWGYLLEGLMGWGIL